MKLMQTLAAFWLALLCSTVLAQGRDLPDFTRLVEEQGGAVVNISTTQAVRRAAVPQVPGVEDEEMLEFFRRFIPRQPGPGQGPGPSPRNESRSLGSGFIISNDGYILTNNHVVGDARAQVSVVMPDKRELRAKIVGVDEATDLALLKIDTRPLPVLPWGDSSKLKVAEWVLAIGNPFQLNQSVTLGIVSALGRSLGGSLAAYEDFIQTDAAINPGNSGGALVNARGELVGINTAIFSESGGYQGIGFAVPSNLARHVMDDLLKYGEVQRGNMPGVWITALTTQVAENLGAPSTRGALVDQMTRDSEAFAAGLRPGDIILTFDSRTVEDASAFMRMIGDSKPGTAARLEILRESRHLELTVPITRSRRTPR